MTGIPITCCASLPRISKRCNRLLSSASPVCPMSPTSARAWRSNRSSTKQHCPSSPETPRFFQQENSMSLSMYNASIPVLQHMLGSLSTILKKAEAHAAAKNIEPGVLISARLFPRHVRFGPANPDRHRPSQRRCGPAGRGGDYIEIRKALLTNCRHASPKPSRSSPASRPNRSTAAKNASSCWICTERRGIQRQGQASTCRS